MANRKLSVVQKRALEKLKSGRWRSISTLGERSVTLDSLVNRDLIEVKSVPAGLHGNWHLEYRLVNWKGGDEDGKTEHR